MSEGGQMESRFPIQYFDGVNSTVQPTLAKRTELSHVENARSPQIGVLEKREGQTYKGTVLGGGVFDSAASNSGLFFFENDSANKGIYRVSTVGATTDIYELNASDEWIKMTDTDAQTLTAGLKIDTAEVDGKIIIVNGTDANRQIDSDGTTVITSAEAGNLYNSPAAKKALYYKNRLHLADFTVDATRYSTTIVRSSFPLGVIALVNGDHDAAVTDLAITDTKYFYSDSGVNTYDIYRGGTLIETITVSAVNETTVTVTATTNALLSSDEVWIAGTYSGEKQFRWINNASATGRNVKQYDTFKLTGSGASPITLFETIGNVMMMGNKTNLATWDDYTLTTLDLGIGCSSDRGYSKLLGTLYFIDYSGIYGTTGGLPTLLSRKVDRYLKGATKAGLEASVAAVKGLSVFFTIGDVTLYNPDGSKEKTMENVALEYSVADQNWYVHTNVDFNLFLNFTDDTEGEQLWGGLNSGEFRVSSFLDGNTDNGAEIFFRVDTQNIQLMKELEITANPIEIVTDTDRGSQMEAYVSLDREQFEELPGTVDKGLSRIKIAGPGDTEATPMRCRRIRVSYRDSSKQRCRITQMAIIYIPSSVAVQHE